MYSTVLLLKLNKYGRKGLIIPSEPSYSRPPNRVKKCSIEDVFGQLPTEKINYQLFEKSMFLTLI